MDDYEKLKEMRDEIDRDNHINNIKLVLFLLACAGVVSGLLLIAIF